jgi:type IV secretory pathway TrbD component
MTQDDKPKREIALKFLEITRADFRQRVELKQQVVIVYAGAIAAILGFVLQNFSRNPAFLNILWVVPLLALLAASFFADHMLATTGLAKYQRDALEPLLRPEATIPLWDFHPAMNTLKSIFWTLQLGQELLICVPATLSLAVACVCFVRHWNALSTPVRVIELFLALFGLFCLVTAFVLLRKIRRDTRIFGPGLA